MALLQQVALIVEDYDRAIAFFVGALDFELVQDARALTNDGRPKWWVVVRPSSDHPIAVSTRIWPVDG
jgi:catechol 2,3-dioxygenase-like lactoylglutathione lyase family enzyme